MSQAGRQWTGRCGLRGEGTVITLMDAPEDEWHLYHLSTPSFTFVSTPLFTSFTFFFNSFPLSCSSCPSTVFSLLHFPLFLGTIPSILYLVCSSPSFIPLPDSLFSHFTSFLPLFLSYSFLLVLFLLFSILFLMFISSFTRFLVFVSSKSFLPSTYLPTSLFSHTLRFYLPSYSSPNFYLF